MGGRLPLVWIRFHEIMRREACPRTRGPSVRKREIIRLGLLETAIAAGKTEIDLRSEFAHANSGIAFFPPFRKKAAKRSFAERVKWETPPAAGEQAASRELA